MNSLKRVFPPVLLLLLVLAPVLLFAQGYKRLSTPQKADFPFKDFTGIKSGSFVMVYVEQAPSYSVRVETKLEGILDDLRVTVEKGYLVIDLSKQFKERIARGHFKRSDVVFYVTSPSIEYLFLAGSGDMIVEKPLTTPTLSVSLVGSGDIKMGDADVQGTFFAKLSGSGDVVVRNVKALEGDVSVVGSGDMSIAHLSLVQRADLSLSGNGDLTVKSLQARSARCSLVGSGDVTVREMSLKGNLILELSGSGDCQIATVQGVSYAEVEAVGSCDLSIEELYAERGNFKLSGSGGIAVTRSGKIGKCEVQLTSSGTINLEALEADYAEVTSRGSGDIFLNVSKELLVQSINGSSEVAYRGNPKLIINDSKYKLKKMEK